MAWYQSSIEATIYRTKLHTLLVINIPIRELNNINIPDGIYNIKGKSTINVMVANHTIKHITFNKGE